MVINKAIENTYKNYISQIADVDLREKSKFIGCQYSSSGLLIPFFNNVYHVSELGVEPVNSSDNPSFGTKVVLLKHILVSSSVEDPYDSPYVTYREFKNSSPLVSYFTNNTNKTIEQEFSQKTDVLQERCIRLHGRKLNNNSYDLSFEFKPLPNVPVVLNFNDSDELFQATCSVLFRKSAEKYLDMECLAMCGTFLTGRLITNKN